jgi:hypothetical protein
LLPIGLLIPTDRSVEYLIELPEVAAVTPAPLEGRGTAVRVAPDTFGLIVWVLDDWPGYLIALRAAAVAAGDRSIGKADRDDTAERADGDRWAGTAAREAD